MPPPPVPPESDGEAEFTSDDDDDDESAAVHSATLAGWSALEEQALAVKAAEAAVQASAAAGSGSVEATAHKAGRPTYIGLYIQRNLSTHMPQLISI